MGEDVSSPSHRQTEDALGVLKSCNGEAVSSPSHRKTKDALGVLNLAFQFQWITIFILIFTV